MKHSDMGVGDQANQRGVVTLPQRLDRADPVVFSIEWQKAYRARSVRIEEAATALLADVCHRYPGEELRCPLMRALDEAVNGDREQALQRLHDET